MSDFEAMFESIDPLARRVQDLRRRAAQQYRPEVDDIPNSGCRDLRAGGSSMRSSTRPGCPA